MLIQNPEITQIVREQTKCTLSEAGNFSAKPEISYVIDVSPSDNKKIITYNSASSTTGTTTPYSGSTGKRLVITAISFNMIKDATCDVATGSLTVLCTVDKISRTICAITTLTLTAQSENIFLSFNRPIICDSGTSVTSGGTFTAGAMRRQIIIYGYEIVD